jgi:hypothetical protein
MALAAGIPAKGQEMDYLVAWFFLMAMLALAIFLKGQW